MLSRRVKMSNSNQSSYVHAIQGRTRCGQHTYAKIRVHAVVCKHEQLRLRAPQSSRGQIQSDNENTLSSFFRTEKSNAKEFSKRVITFVWIKCKANYQQTRIKDSITSLRHRNIHSSVNIIYLFSKSNHRRAVKIFTGATLQKVPRYFKFIAKLLLRLNFTKGSNPPAPYEGTPMVYYRCLCILKYLEISV